jgi:chemotaxis regulatin CheY-phosphate phosphatase CheZ
MAPANGREPVDDDILAELRALRHDIAAAAESILSAVESGLSELNDSRDVDGAVARAKNAFHVVLEACAFQDLTGQRLSRIENLLTGAANAGLDPLLNGPALTGRGLDQAAADALFAEFDAPNGTSPWPQSRI